MERPSEDEARQAVETLIRWAGDDPSREGLRATPDRVVRSYREFFGGYDQDPTDLLSKTFSEVEGYDEGLEGGFQDWDISLALAERGWVLARARGSICAGSSTSRPDSA